MQHTNSYQDDEELARMLQYQEQTAARSAAATASMGEQEQRDSELARQFAEMEMNPGGGHHASSSRRAHSLDRQDSARRFSYPVHGTNNLTQQPQPSAAAAGHRQQSYSLSSASYHMRGTHSFNEYDSRVAPVELALGDLEYAQRLQEEAFARLPSTRPGVSQIVHSPEERASMELARRMMQQEQERSSPPQRRNSLQSPSSGGGSTSGGEYLPNLHSSSSPPPSQDMDSDERLARAIEALGKSLRDLDADERLALLMETTGRSLRDLDLQMEPEEEEGVAIGQPVSPQPNGSGSASPIVGARVLPNTPSLDHSDSVGAPNTDETQSRVRKPSRKPLPAAAATRPSTDTGEAQMLPQDDNAAFLDVPAPVDKKKKGRNLWGFRRKQQQQQSPTDVAAPVSAAPDMRKPPPGAARTMSADALSGIPAAIPPPPGGSLSSGRLGASPAAPRHRKNMTAPHSTTGSSVCFSCGKSSGSFVAALDKKFHPECFRCVVCNELIDIKKPFAFSRDEQGYKHPHHPRCFSQRYASTCCICREKLPANEDGTISFVKHPFFETEEMCPRHALEGKRRCTGCHRFEPDFENFVDLDDGDRCLCFSCCRSVVINSKDATPLWSLVIGFFKTNLGLPIWDGMSEIPIMIVGYEALNEQLQLVQNAHGGSSQIMTRGLCLTDHSNCGQSFRVPSLRYNATESSFEASNGNDRFTYYEVPQVSQGNPNSSVFAILCLSGLPRDLTASVLAHEATHAWIKMHPEFDASKPIPAQVEEGVAQLIAMLFLNEGLDAPAESVPGETGPSDAKLRQYFRFSIETEENEIYGRGYRRAAAAYQALGIEALLTHVVRYRDFPHT